MKSNKVSGHMLKNPKPIKETKTQNNNNIEGHAINSE